MQHKVGGAFEVRSKAGAAGWLRWCYARTWALTRGRRYLSSFVLGAVASAGAFYGMLAGLAALDRLPPPPVNGTLCIDEKFAWLRTDPERLKAGVLAVGSSVTLRNLDFGALSPEARAAAGGFLNGATCYLRLNQTRFLTNFYLDQQPRFHTVLTIIAPRDFSHCSTNPTEFFDRELLTKYLHREVNGWWLYFRNFRPRFFLRDVVMLPQEREEFDPYGSGPLVNDEPIIWQLATPDPSCYGELRRLADELHGRGAQLVVVTAPVMPAWLAADSSNVATEKVFESGIRAALAGSSAVLIDKGWQAPTNGFADPLHLQWPAVAGFTRFVWNEALRNGARMTAPTAAAVP